SPFGGTAGTPTATQNTITDIVIPSTTCSTQGCNYDFPEVQVVPYSISGIKYFDKNANDVFDAGDEGLPGVTIVLSGTQTATGPSVSLTTTTDANGAYSFTNLMPGTYQLTELVPTGIANPPLAATLIDETANVGTPFGGTPGPIVTLPGGKQNH